MIFLDSISRFHEFVSLLLRERLIVIQGEEINLGRFDKIGV